MQLILPDDDQLPVDDDRAAQQASQRVQGGGGNAHHMPGRDSRGLIRGAAGHGCHNRRVVVAIRQK